MKTALLALATYATLATVPAYVEVNQRVNGYLDNWATTRVKEKLPKEVQDALEGM